MLGLAGWDWRLEILDGENYIDVGDREDGRVFGLEWMEQTLADKEVQTLLVHNTKPQDTR